MRSKRPLSSRDAQLIHSLYAGREEDLDRRSGHETTRQKLGWMMHWRWQSLVVIHKILSDVTEGFDGIHRRSTQCGINSEYNPDGDRDPERDGN